MYLFDTDTLSNIVKRKPSFQLLEKLTGMPKSIQFTSAINVGEIYYGALRSPHKQKILKAFIEKVFPKLNILSFDRGGAEVFGFLKAELVRKGFGCSEPDLRIAAITIQHNLTLITGNIKHFLNIPGLRVENWI